MVDIILIRPYTKPKTGRVLRTGLVMTCDYETAGKFISEGYAIECGKSQVQVEKEMLKFEEEE